MKLWIRGEYRKVLSEQSKNVGVADGAMQCAIGCKGEKPSPCGSANAGKNVTIHPEVPAGEPAA